MQSIGSHNGRWVALMDANPRKANVNHEVIFKMVLDCIDSCKTVSDESQTIAVIQNGCWFGHDNQQIFSLKCLTQQDN